MRQKYAVFNAEAEGLVAVQTVSGSEGKLNHYFVIGNQYRAMEVESIEADPALIYYVPLDCIESYIDRQKNQVLNRLNYIAVTDKNGNPIQTPAIMEEIFPEIAALEHDLFCIRIYKIRGEYFVYVELNVNMWSPCSLYYYHRERGRLLELFTFNDEEIRQIQILSSDRLKALP